VPPHILHIPRWFPHKGDAMLGLFVKNQILSLEPEYLNTVLFIHFVDRQDTIFSIETDSDEKIRTINVFIRKAAKSGGLLNNAINACRYFRASMIGYRLISKQYGRPDLCHVHVLTRTGLPALWLRFFHGIPYIVSEHWSRYIPDNKAFNGRIRQYFTRFIIKKSSALVCVSESLHKAMKTFGLDHKNYFTIPNVVDTELFKPGSVQKPGARIQLINISCFEDQSKNISGLLEALRILVQKKVEIRLVLVGDGIDRQNLENLASDPGISEAVEFTGTLMPDELVYQLQRSDFLVQTSHYETFSTVVAESFACGIPVISTAVGIFPEVYQPDTGVMIDSGSPDAIAEAITRAISMRGQFNGIKMRQIATNRFSKAQVGKLLMSCYHSVFKQAK